MRRFNKLVYEHPVSTIALITLLIFLPAGLFAACGSSSKPSNTPPPGQQNVPAESSQMFNDHRIGVTSDGNHYIEEFSTPDARCVQDEDSGNLSCWPQIATPPTTIAPTVP